MPILPPEPMYAPDCLFEDENQFPSRDWWVLHVRPRQEKSLSRELYQWEIPYYLPQVRRTSHNNRRATSAYIPLFPGYVFLLATQEERIQALTTKRVVQSIVVSDQQQLLADLQQNVRLLETGARLSHEPKFVPGTPVRILRGPLKGFVGVVERTATQQRLIVWIHFIQQGASVTIDQESLVVVEEEAL